MNQQIIVIHLYILRHILAYIFIFKAHNFADFGFTLLLLSSTLFQLQQVAHLC